MKHLKLKCQFVSLCMILLCTSSLECKPRVRIQQEDTSGMALQKLVPTSFFFIRHGQTDWNKEHKLQGQTDIPLNDTGREQAKALQNVVCTLNIKHVYASPLSRAKETMDIACKHLDVPKQLLDGLKERNFGEWEGTSWDEQKSGSHLQFVPAHGESYSAFHNRLLDDVNSALQSATGPVLLVGHGGVFRAFCRATETSTKFVPNCQLFYFIAPKEEGGEWVLHTF